jgi:glutaredoxin
VLRKDGYSERAIFVIDRQGIIRYIDMHDIDDQPRNEELFAILRSIDPEAAANAPIEKAEEQIVLPRGGIVMYCNSWCPGCRRARAWFEAHGLPYKEIDISRNRAAADQVRQWANGNETTPTFDIDGAILIEFDEERMIQILGDRIKP